MICAESETQCRHGFRSERLLPLRESSIEKRHLDLSRFAAYVVSPLCAWHLSAFYLASISGLPY